MCAVGCSAISVFHSCAGIERPGRGGFGGAEDGVACHVFSSNHQYPIGRRWADLCAMQYVWGNGSGTGCLHPSVSRATFPNSCDGTNLPFHRDWGPSITVLNIHDKFGTVRAYPEGAIRRLNQYSFGGLMHRGFFSHFSAYSWQQSTIEDPHPFESPSSSSLLNSNKQRKSPHPSIIHHLTFAHLCRSNPFLHHRLPSTSC